MARQSEKDKYAEKEAYLSTERRANRANTSLKDKTLIARTSKWAVWPQAYIPEPLRLPPGTRTTRTEPEKSKTPAPQTSAQIAETTTPQNVTQTADKTNLPQTVAQTVPQTVAPPDSQAARTVAPQKTTTAPTTNRWGDEEEEMDTAEITVSATAATAGDDADSEAEASAASASPEVQVIGQKTAEDRDVELTDVTPAAGSSAQTPKAVIAATQARVREKLKELKATRAGVEKARRDVEHVEEQAGRYAKRLSLANVDVPNPVADAKLLAKVQKAVKKVAEGGVAFFEVPVFGYMRRHGDPLEKDEFELDGMYRNQGRTFGGRLTQALKFPNGPDYKDMGKIYVEININLYLARTSDWTPWMFTNEHGQQVVVMEYFDVFPVRPEPVFPVTIDTFIKPEHILKDFIPQDQDGVTNEMPEPLHANANQQEFIDYVLAVRSFGKFLNLLTDCLTDERKIPKPIVLRKSKMLDSFTPAKFMRTEFSRLVQYELQCYYGKPVVKEEPGFLAFAGRALADRVGL